MALLGILRMVWRNPMFLGKASSRNAEFFEHYRLSLVHDVRSAERNERVHWELPNGRGVRFVKAWKCLSSLFEKFRVGQDGKCNSDQFSFRLLLLVIHLGIEYIASADIGEWTSSHKLVFASPTKKSKLEPWTCFTKKHHIRRFLSKVMISIFVWFHMGVS